MRSEKIMDRRLGPDFRVKLSRVLTLLAWLILLISLFTFNYARPDILPGYAKYKGLEELFRLEWDIRLSNFLFVELVFCCVMSFINIIIHRTRSRRASDNMGFNQVMLLVVSITAASYVWFEVLN